MQSRDSQEEIEMKTGYKVLQPLAEVWGTIITDDSLLLPVAKVWTFTIFNRTCY